MEPRTRDRAVRRASVAMAAMSEHFENIFMRVELPGGASLKTQMGFDWDCFHCAW